MKATYNIIRQCVTPIKELLALVDWSMIPYQIILVENYHNMLLS